MYSNEIIINKMQADKTLALRLEDALSGVKKQVLEQANYIESGVRRLSFYASCFTDNYQDVCASQKKKMSDSLKGLFNWFGTEILFLLWFGCTFRYYFKIRKKTALPEYKKTTQAGHKYFIKRNDQSGF